MQYRMTTLIITTLILVMSGFQLSSALASPLTAGVVYYVDGDHPNARDRTDYGVSTGQPWKTLNYALLRLGPGDTLMVGGAVYPATSNLSLDGSQRSGTQQAPITVQVYPNETAIWRSTQQQTALIFGNVSWWRVEGLIFEGQGLQLGKGLTTIARHITISNCVFRNGSNRALRIYYAEHILVESSHFQRLQSQNAGEDLSAVNIPYHADDIVIRNSKFEDISSDGIHLGANNISITNITIEGNEFWINNPDQVFLGENGIDVKRVQGPVYIRGNIVHGFRPTVEGQNASGSNGVGVVLHNNAENVTLEKNFFYDNTTHLEISIGKGTVGGTRNIIVRNNIFKEARSNDRAGSLEGGYAIRVSKAAQVQVYHNTFYDNDSYLVSDVASDSTFKNNVIFKGRGAIKPQAIWQADYNAWSQVSFLPTPLRGSHDLQVTNLNLDANLRPQPGSPVIDAGQQLGLTDDFAGNPRTDGKPDLGAFEAPLAQRADLLLSGVDSPDPVTAGGALTYTFTITNTGPTLASSVTLTQTLPPSLLFSSAIAGQGSCTGSGPVICNLGNLANGLSTKVTIVGRSTVKGTITSTTTVGSGLFDPQLTNNRVVQTTQINPGADLAIGHTVNNSNPQINQIITLRVMVRNTGPDQATSVAIKAKLPSSLALNSYTASRGSYTGSTGRWSVGTLAATRAATLTIKAKVKPNASGQTITNTASLLTVTPADPNGSNNTASVVIVVAGQTQTVMVDPAAEGKKDDPATPVATPVGDPPAPALTEQRLYLPLIMR